MITSKLEDSALIFLGDCCGLTPCQKREMSALENSFITLTEAVTSDTVLIQ